MPAYRIELQKPYGTLVDVYEGPSLYVAIKKKTAFLRRSDGYGFVPCFINGKEVPPARISSTIVEKGKK